MGETLYDVERKRQKPSILILSVTVGIHSGVATLPGKKRVSCRSCQKTKHVWGCENYKHYVCGTWLKPVCLKCFSETE